MGTGPHEVPPIQQKMTPWGPHEVPRSSTNILSYVLTEKSTSSAAVERVFSILKNLIGDQQSNALQDLVNGTMLVNFNQRRRLAGR